MNQQLPELIQGMRRALAEDVQAELSTDHARSQLAGVLDILSKLERMVSWSPDVLREQLEILQRGCDAFAQRAAREGVQRDALPACAAESPSSQAGLDAALRSAQARLDACTDWLFDHAAQLPAPARAELHELLQQTLRELLLTERKLIPRANFNAMTAGAARPETRPAA